jgi:hypothetical protein
MPAPEDTNRPGSAMLTGAYVRLGSAASSPRPASADRSGALQSGTTENAPAEFPLPPYLRGTLGLIPFRRPGTFQPTLTVRLLCREGKRIRCSNTEREGNHAIHHLVPPEQSVRDSSH